MASHQAASRRRSSRRASVSGATIADASVTSADIQDGPRAAFVEDAVSYVPLPGLLTVIQSVTLTAPAAGRVIANFSATLEFTSASIQEAGFCGLSTTPTGSGVIGAWSWAWAIRRRTSTTSA